ncbi:sulfite reductase subunit alpha [Uliginosibacterium sp. 31-16]|uniref:sulfite reductase subunit alpha n=1 Tax=Uliginosibacterium sp. 31-16 TaxID=3068315 RepID=UPI00273F0B96|nr:sulfite reductase subunit alpha [Uliginosibacterium sp. 31-16]MDP5238176.1 sulfite reductase subunit alpha [Uliginosibacterium sp. 31-16]
MDLTTYLSGDAWRLWAALSITFAYTLFCYVLFHRARNAGQITVMQQGTGKPVLVVYASQTGQAESIARHTASELSGNGTPVHLSRIDQPWLEDAASASRVFFIVSTAGDGSSPDHALGFVHKQLDKPCAGLQGVRFGLLALGDRNYPDFCAFGRRLDQWLQACGAQPEFSRIEVDKLEGQALAAWNGHLQGFGTKIQAGAPAATEPDDYAEWRLLSRCCLNAGSPGSSMCKVVLQPVSGGLPQWHAGDLADVLIPGGDGKPRSYSISNLPDDNRIELIVRSVVREDGTSGQTSGWLNQHAQPGDALKLRVRSNPGFNLGADLSKPLILIGAGTGIAGLRGHLQARAKAFSASAQPAPEHNTWLLFGERSGRHDRPCHAEIDKWQHTRLLTRLDLSFSRDDPRTPYVQHHLQEHAKELQEWVENGANILVCGCAKTMARSVDQSLRNILGDASVDDLLMSGRMRRDIF